jgi:hypothetical protein
MTPKRRRSERKMWRQLERQGKTALRKEQRQESRKDGENRNSESSQPGQRVRPAA